MQWLVNKGHIKAGDNGLDYGCGKGDDADALGFVGYDPYHRDTDITDEFFDIVTCNYVLNAIEDPAERLGVEIDLILRAKKKAFLSVRNDVRALNGRTSRGTWQGIVEPDSEKWELLASNSHFKLWMYDTSTECEGE